MLGWLSAHITTSTNIALLFHRGHEDVIVKTSTKYKSSTKYMPNLRFISETSQWIVTILDTTDLWNRCSFWLNQLSLNCI